MLLVELAAYILFITLILYFAPRILWLIFLLFSYRTWEALLPYEKVSEHIAFSSMKDYYIMILIIAVITYALVMIASQAIPVLQYIFLLVMAFYVMKTYSVADIILFKDHLQNHGMWNTDYWINQIRELFQSSNSEKEAVFERVYNNLKSLLTRIWGYVNEL